MLTCYLHAKLEADDGDLAEEGAHGFWELSIGKDNHMDIRMDRLAALLAKLQSANFGVATTTAFALWGLGVTASSRRNLADLDVVPAIMNKLKLSLKLVVVPDASSSLDTVSESQTQESHRNFLQEALLGSLAMLLIDRSCRRPYIQLEPDYITLFTLCKNLEGYSVVAAKARRETSAKILASLMQRDPEARRSLILTGGEREPGKDRKGGRGRGGEGASLGRKRRGGGGGGGTILGMTGRVAGRQGESMSVGHR